jgi:hypothetical protein
VSKLYNRIKEKINEDPTSESYPGTILDFLLDRLACGLKFSTIQADYRLIWHSDISEEDILEIIKGHESEIPERRKQAAEQIKKTNLLTMYLDAIKDCYQCVKNAKSSKEKIYYLNTLHTYLAIYVKNTDQKEVNIQSEVSPDAVISLLDGIMKVGGQNEYGGETGEKQQRKKSI